MTFSTGQNSGPAPRNRRVIYVVATVIALAVLLVVAILVARGSLGASTPQPEEVIGEFQSRGLEVGEVQPVIKPGEPAGPLPQTYEDGRRFLIPSIGPDSGGRVFVFDNNEDLQAVKNYYEGLNEAGGFLCCSYIYQNDLTLLQLPGEVPKNQAEDYDSALQAL